MIRIWLVVLLLVGITQYSHALTCRALVESSVRATVTITDKTQAIRLRNNKNIHFKLNDSEKILEALSQNFSMSAAEVQIFKNKSVSLIKLVDFMMSKLQAEASSVTEKSDKLSKIYHESIKNLIATLKADQQKPAQFTLVKALLDIEAFKPSEFRTNDSLCLADKPMLYVHINDFFEITKSYIENKAPYADIPQSGAGVLEFRDIRDIESHNYFPVEFKGHDARHIHFSTGHPYTIGTVWSAARSKNHLRYVLVSGLYEGVDTAQYSWERKLTSYFRSKGFMLEEALMEVALMRQAEIENLANEVGANFVVVNFQNWIPTVKGDFTVAGKSGRGFEAEIVSAMEKIFDVLKNSDFNKFTNYNRNVPDQNGIIESDHTIHN